MHRPGPLTGRHALVTGGARGLGRVMAEAIAGAGARVTITAARSRVEIDDAVRAIGPDRCRGVLGDVSSPDDCSRVADAARQAFGEPDILINNAGRGPRDQWADQNPESGLGPWTVDPDAFARILLTNVAGPWLMARALAPAMETRGWGRIVNISTSWPTMTYARGGPYGPSKAALEAQTSIWAEHLEDTGVTANILLPGGATDTDFIPGGCPGTRATPDWPRIAGTIEQGRMKALLPPSVMAAPILWLASDASGWCNGQRIVAANWPPHLSADEALALALSD